MVYDETFTIAAETNNPLGLFATVARWDGDRLTRARLDPVADDGAPDASPQLFGVPESDVRVLVPYLGGGFGAGLQVWPHVILTGSRPGSWVARSSWS